jgi:hypothetical protein
MKYKKESTFAVVLSLCLLGWTSLGQKQPANKPTWEYVNLIVADYEGLASLNNAGAQGWELVAVTQGANSTKMYHFKRMK